MLINSIIVAPLALSSDGNGGPTPLGFAFQPGPNDVICARGKEAFSHSGNKNFRKLVERFTAQYAATSCKSQRSSIVSDVVDAIRARGNGFVKQEKDGMWIEVGETLAREKAGQLFRNALSDQYKSSTTSKRRRRYSNASKFQQALHNIMISNHQVKKTTDLMAKVAAHSKITDEEVVSQFSSRNLFLLEGVIKTNKSLVDEFQRKLFASTSSGSSSTESSVASDEQSLSDGDEVDSIDFLS